MPLDKLRAIFGKLTDMSFDIARLDTLTRQRESLKGLALELSDRSIAGIEGLIEEDFLRLAGLLGFEVARDATSLGQGAAPASAEAPR